jgi:signal transduction histidine kinase
MRWAMWLAVPLVFALAWADQRREQARALQEFTREQETLAGALAEVLAAHGSLDHVPLPPEARYLVSPIAGDHPEVRALGEAMSRGESGTRTLSRPAASSLGLPSRMAVAAFTPAGAGVSVAVVASARQVRDRASVGSWRLGTATGLAGALVALFGWMVTRRERRALALQQALAVAEKTAALQRSLQRAEKLATIGTLAAGVAHEVGTPLGIISGRAEQALARAQADDEPTKKALASILAQVDKVSTTIRQLLDFARTRPVEAGPVAPGAILETCRGLLEHRFKQATVSLTVDAAPSLPPVLGDAGQLEQVFVNLLINAADACARGGTVNASVRAHGDKLRFEIQDDGCGILPQNLPQVLDPFFTTKKRGQGTGLGLTIAADIIKNHNGTLDIESEPGKGTKVSVELPRS